MANEALDMVCSQASELNTQGSRSGNINHSFECFRNALCMLLTKTPRGTDIMSTASSPAMLRAASSLCFQPQLYHIMLWTKTGRENVSPDPCIFSTPFIFCPQEDTRCALSLRLRVAMLFFNLALTIHKNSASLRYSECALHVALDLYDVGFDLLLEDEACSNDDQATDISLGILANKAEIHWVLSDFAKCARVLELQSSLLDIQQSNRRPSSYTEQEMEIFAMNVHLLQPPTCAAVA